MDDKLNPCPCGAVKRTTLNTYQGKAYIKCEACQITSKEFSLFEAPLTEFDNPVQRAVKDWNTTHKGDIPS